MPTNPTSGWDKIPVYGTYKNLDGTPKRGTVELTLDTRLTAVDGSAIYPGGGRLSVSLDGVGAVSIMMPASDDPDIFPNGWAVRVDERLNDGSGKSYFVNPTLAAGEVNLARVIVPEGSPSVLPPVLIKGVPNGVAGLNADGNVINAAGEEVTAGNTGPALTSWSEVAALPNFPVSFPPTIGSGPTSAVAGNDARLTDARAPIDGSVTNAKVAMGAGISLDKTADSSTKVAMTPAERTKLANVGDTSALASQVSTLSTSMNAKLSFAVKGQPRPVTAAGVPVVWISYDGTSPAGGGTVGGGAGMVEGLDLVLLGPA